MHSMKRLRDFQLCNAQHIHNSHATHNTPTPIHNSRFVKERVAGHIPGGLHE
jgi:hypothetical protein